MLVNDDLGLTPKDYSTKVVEVREFDKFEKHIYNLFNRFIIWIFRIPMNITKKYLYDCIFKIENNIFENNDSLEINGISMHVTNIDKFSNTIWCTSLDWNYKLFERKDFKGKHLLKTGNMYQ